MKLVRIGIRSGKRVMIVESSGYGVRGTRETCQVDVTLPGASHIFALEMSAQDARTLAANLVEAADRAGAH